MISVTPISIAATSQSYAASVTENLCQAFCLNQSVQPQATATYSVASQQTVGTTTFVTVQAVVSILYLPKSSCSCKPQTRLYTETFDVAFSGTGTPTIAVTQGASVNSPANVKCCGDAYGYNIVTDVVIAATFPS